MVSSAYPWIYILLPRRQVISININNSEHTDMNDTIVFLFVPFKKNNIIVLIIIHITSVGIIGLNPHPTIITNRNINARFIYIVKNVFRPLLPPINSRRINNISDNTFIII